MNPGRRKFDAFTLTEMLTVVVVLGILTSMVVTGLSSSKSKAVNIQCQSNLRQWGIALNSFVSTHHSYPLGLNPKRSGFSADHGGMFYTSLKNEGLGPAPDQSPYKNPSVYLCPSAQRQPLPPQLGGEISMYGYNALGFGGDKAEPLGLGFKSEDQFFSPVPESAVQSPSQMLALGEGIMGWKDRYEDGTWVLGRLSSTEELVGSTRRVQKRHAGKANTAFCDGHVESRPLRFLFSDETEAALASWNRDHQPHRERLQ